MDPPKEMQPGSQYGQPASQYGGWIQQQPSFGAPVYGYAPAAVQRPTTTVVFASSPPSYLAWSVLNLLFCCFPLGIAATVLSVSVNDYSVIGNHAEAKRRSDSARVLNIISTIMGLLIWVAVGVVFGLFWNEIFNDYYYYIRP